MCAHVHTHVCVSVCALVTWRSRYVFQKKESGLREIRHQWNANIDPDLNFAIKSKLACIPFDSIAFDILSTSICLNSFLFLKKCKESLRRVGQRQGFQSCAEHSIIFTVFSNKIICCAQKHVKCIVPNDNCCSNKSHIIHKIKK